MTPKKSDPKPKESISTPAHVTVAKAAEPPKPTVPTPTPTTQPQPTATKQSQVVAKLKQAWSEKGIKLDQLNERQDGKFILLQPTPEWPIIRIGPTGGVELPQIRSYAKAWDAALDGLAVWQKQQHRDQKKATATSAPAQAPKPQPPAQSVKPETPTARKARKDAALEARLA
jgi:hypothetical protein